MPVSACLGSGHPGLAHRVALRLKLQIDPKIAVIVPPGVLRHLQHAARLPGYWVGRNSAKFSDGRIFFRYLL